MRGQRQHAALIETWFELLPLHQQSNARSLHDLVHSAVPDFEMTVRNGCLVYALRGTHVMALAPFRTHMHVQVFHSGALVERFPELDGAGRGLRQVRLRHGQWYDGLLIESLAQAVAAEAASFVHLRREH